MQTITLELKNKEDAEIILSIAKRLDCKIVISESQMESNNEEIISLMKSIAGRGTIAKAIPDPVAWQREMRKDRPLPGRE